VLAVLPLLISAMTLPFQAGEKLDFEVRYLGLTAGEVSFSVEAEPGQPERLRIRSEGRTINAADSLFRIRSESFCVVESPGILPVWCRSTFTSRRTDRRREVRYDRRGGKVHETLLDAGAVEKHVRDLGADPSAVQEFLSAMYLTRTLALTPGQPVSFTGFRGEKRVVVEGHPEAVETVSTPSGPRSAVRLAIVVKEKMEKDAQDGGRVWLSDDPRHVPLKMSFEGPVGTIEVLLVRAGGLLPGPELAAAR
jgi:hypothetical protein